VSAAQGHQALRPRLRWRAQAVGSWVRWNLPVRRETALRLAEQEAEDYYFALEAKVVQQSAKIDAVFTAMQDIVREADPAPEEPRPERHLHLVRPT
jgi:hypothetical protein